MYGLFIATDVTKVQWQGIVLNERPVQKFEIKGEIEVWVVILGV